MTLTPTDRAVIAMVARELDGDEDPRLRLGIRASAVAVDRWGRDLELKAGRQEYGHFEQALEASVADVIDHYRDEDADVDGVDGYVFEGRVVTEELLREIAADLTETIVELGGVHRDQPGGLVEAVEADGGESA